MKKHHVQALTMCVSKEEQLEEEVEIPSTLLIAISLKRDKYDDSAREKKGQ